MDRAAKGQPAASPACTCPGSRNADSAASGQTEAKPTQAWNCNGFTPSICFIITRPKPREVWAAGFRDRVVHHLLYNHVSPRFYASFTADSCACIPGRDSRTPFGSAGIASPAT